MIKKKSYLKTALLPVCQQLFLSDLPIRYLVLLVFPL